MVARTYSLCGEVDGPWAVAVDAVLKSAGWSKAADADLLLFVPRATAPGASDFAEAERLQVQLDAVKAKSTLDALGEVAATTLAVALFDGRIRTLKQHFAGRSAVDAARRDIVVTAALGRAPALRVTGLEFGAAPEGPDQRDPTWQAAQVERISVAIPDLSRLPSMLTYLAQQKAVTGQIIRLENRV
ncbi:hypothetical protein [Pontivivens insulae]|uniref:Uncharacterized protein n=1 Tax=Pontivivens insulae TaxID=1639689 RepID=A0A2R8A6L9_9RHOB|nr:hypothetical protein [Pontivivens insulae]RED17912.1 hypothetical protein DFR53_0100 [Pontivivens insulae]SPF27802.1 hypothetical protein POI8812_00097 [Pontivivens insulae]